MPIFRVKSVKIYTGQKKFTQVYSWLSWQISGMHQMKIAGIISNGGSINLENDFWIESTQSGVYLNYLSNALTGSEDGEWCSGGEPHKGRQTSH